MPGSMSGVREIKISKVIEFQSRDFRVLHIYTLGLHILEPKVHNPNLTMYKTYAIITLEDLPGEQYCRIAVSTIPGLMFELQYPCVGNC